MGRGKEMKKMKIRALALILLLTIMLLSACAGSNVKMNIPCSEEAVLKFAKNMIKKESSSNFEMELATFDGSYWHKGTEVQVIYEEGSPFGDEETRCFVRLWCKKPGQARGQVEMTFYENQYDLSHEVYEIKLSSDHESGEYSDYYVQDVACSLMKFLSGNLSSFDLQMTGEKYEWMQYTCKGKYVGYEVGGIRQEFYIALGNDLI